MTIMEQLYLEETPDLREISEAMVDAFVSIDSEWRIRFLNNKATYLIQKKREELVGNPLWEVFPQAVGTQIDLELHKVMEHRRDNTFEFYYEPSLIWLEIRAYPQVGGICVFFTDITEKKRLSKESYELTQRFLLYAKTNPVGIFHIDGYGNCLFVNDKWLELTGFTAEEATGCGWMQALHEEDRDAGYEDLKEAIKTGKSVDKTYRFRNKKTGLTLQAHIMATPVREDGTVSGYVACIEDITEKVKAHQIILESEKWFRNVVNNAPVMICSIGANKECTFVNNTWLEFTGRTYEEEMAVNWLDDIYTDDRERVINLFDEAFDQRREFRSEYRVRYRDETYRWVSVAGKPMYSPDGTFCGFISTAADVNERVMVYQELEDRVKERTMECTLALEREKELGNLKSRFVSVASHEFRTPLTTILSSVELMETYLAINEPQNLQKHVERIKSSVKHLRGVLDDFLSVEELEQGNVRKRKSVFDLRTYIAETVEELESLLKKDQKIKCTHTGNHKINSDKEIINHILFNLLSNAIKYSEKDVLLHTESKKDSIKITITDQGIGIPEEEQHHLFDNYFRASNVGNIKGTGLGLNIVKRYIEILGGSISFTSVSGAGTQFILKLPKGLS